MKSQQPRSFLLIKNIPAIISMLAGVLLFSTLCPVCFFPQKVSWNLINVADAKPVIVADVSPRVAYTNETIIFDATQCFDDSGGTYSIVNYTWIFDDQAHNSQSPNIVYEPFYKRCFYSPKNYSVVLTILNNAPQPELLTWTFNITILNREPVAVMTLTGSEDEYTFSLENSYDPEGSALQYGFASDDISITSFTSTSKMKFTFGPGYHTVRGVVRDSEGSESRPSVISLYVKEKKTLETLATPLLLFIISVLALIAAAIAIILALMRKTQAPTSSSSLLSPPPPPGNPATANATASDNMRLPPPSGTEA
ncbi:MAG: hypothetical protein QW728_01345, partial [Thermoplasmata archaeon]